MTRADRFESGFLPGSFGGCSCKIIPGKTGTAKWSGGKIFQYERKQPASSPLIYGGGGRKFRSPCREAREGAFCLKTERNVVERSPRLGRTGSAWNTIEISSLFVL